MMRILLIVAVVLLIAISALGRPDADPTSDPCYPYACQSLD